MSDKNQPDWDKIAEKFDMWLPHISPVADKMLAAIHIQPGTRILDVANGTGEPGLSIAKNMGKQVTVVATDAAQGMVDAAQNKARREKVTNMEFHCMPAEKLTFDNESFDAVMCRFGIMLFEDSIKGMKEMHRVLKPGAPYAFTVWNTPETMPLMNWFYLALKDKIPEDVHPPVKKVTSMGGEGIFAKALEAAGYSNVTIETHHFDYQFSSFDEFWDLMEASEVMKMQFDAINQQQHITLRDEVGQFANEFLTSKGFHIPHEYLLAYGNK